MSDATRGMPNEVEGAVDSPYLPKQKRSAETHAEIVTAARELILEGGAKSLTITDVAARAGLTTGALYARFRNKDAIIEALCRETVEADKRMMEEFIAELEERQATPAEAVRAAIPLTLRTVREHGALFRLMSSDLMRTEEMRPSILQMLEENIRLIQAWYKSRRDLVPHANPELAAIMLVALTQGMIDWALTLNESYSHLVHITDEVLIEEMTRAALGYLGLSATEEEPTQPKGPSGKS